MSACLYASCFQCFISLSLASCCFKMFLLCSSSMDCTWDILEDLSSWYFIFISLYCSSKSLRTDDSPTLRLNCSTIVVFRPSPPFLVGRSPMSYKPSNFFEVFEIFFFDTLVRNLPKSGVSISESDMAAVSFGLSSYSTAAGVSGCAFFGGLPTFFFFFTSSLFAGSLFFLFCGGFAAFLGFSALILKSLGLDGATARRDLAACTTSTLASSLAFSATFFAAVLFLFLGFLFSLGTSW
mmetsp:Transcript_5384/g.16277  ORF Transcript_5384/g.16277 Transcript_5384/m.16277 type:complete len:238 (-) Transcript_5384:560-1273(-)